MAMDLFLQIDTWIGESEDKQFNKWVDILAWSWGGSQSGTAVIGGGMGGGKVNMQNFSCTKFTDILTPKLWQHLCKGTHIPEIRFRARKAGGTPFVYLELDFKDAIVTGVSTGGSGGEDRTTENLTFDYKEYKLKYYQQAATGDSAGDDEVTYNIATNEAS